MNKVVEILMERDGMSKREAYEALSEAREALLSGEDDAIQTYLGLEDDYIFDVIG